ncbi:hypothetical protein PCANB_002020 [Pneumocystis canis]|nr:hypothetical protein PCANB_002020 [Pneumocystis canis]
MSITHSKKESARETIDILYEISLILNTGLDKNSLSLCVSLCENGVSPDSLTNVIKELRKHKLE